MPEHVWSNFDSMRPVTPETTGQSPITLIENMVKTQQGTLVRRSGFEITGVALPATPQNHINVSLAGTSQRTLVIKAQSALYAKTNHAGAFAALTLPKLPDSAKRGSFGTVSGEIYYCDPKAILRWDGLADPVIPGMPQFVDPVAYPPWNYTGAYDVTQEPLWWDPLNGFDGKLITGGGKIGTFAVSYAFYDRKRNIYGRRSDPKTAIVAVTLSGPAGIGGATQVELFGLKKLLPTSDSPGLAGNEVAVFCSQAVTIAARNINATVQGENVNYNTQLTFRPGDFIADLQFLETFGSENGFVNLVKDNAALAASQRASDNFEPPHPSDHMMIMPDGSALYFFPNTQLNATGSRRYLVEFGVGHPEQVGRDVTDSVSRRAENGPSESPVADLRGTPLYSSGNILITDISAFQVRFSGAFVQVNEIGPYGGARNPIAFARSDLGISYVSDDGHILITGEGSTNLDSDLGYSPYYSPLSASQLQNNTALGDGMDRLVLWMPDVNPETGKVGASVANTAMVFDHSLRHLTRWRAGGGALDIKYCCGAMLQDGTRLVMFDISGNAYSWPSVARKDGVDSFGSQVVFVLDEAPAVNKTMGSLLISFGAARGLTPSEGDEGVRIIVESFVNPFNTAGKGYNSESFDFPSEDCENQQVRVAVQGMQGRAFRFTVQSGPNWTDGDLEILKVVAAFEADEDVSDGPATN